MPNPIVRTLTIDGTTYDLQDNISGYVTTDTKNTAGATNTSDKIFIVGAKTQATNPQTYTQDTAYVGSNGHLYSASKEVLVGGSNSSSSVSITPSTTNIYSITGAGSVTPGTANTPTAIDTTKFNGGSFTQGKDSFTPASHGADSFTPASLGTGFYTAGTKGTPTTIDTTKFNGGSFTSGAFSGGSFTQGSDNFTPASLGTGFYSAGTKGSPTTIDTSKFNAGSFTSGTFSQGSLPTLSMAMDTIDEFQLNISWGQGSLPSHGSDSFTPPSLGSGFYSVGTATTPASIDVSKFSGGSFSQGTDSFTPATHAADSHTPASLGTGFYSAGTATTPASIDVTKFNGGSFSSGTFSGGSFTQGTDSHTAASLGTGFYTPGTANTPTSVTLPTVSSTATAVWTGYTTATAAAQTFTGATS